MLARQDRPGWRCKVKQLEYGRRYLKARYRRFLAAGMCGSCGKEHPVVGVRCGTCAINQYDRERQRIR